MQVNVMSVVDNIKYFLPYIAISYITVAVIFIIALIIIKKFSINSKLNYLYGLFISDNFGMTVKLTLLLTKLVFICTFFITGLEYSNMIFMLFLLIDITFLLDGFKPFIFLLNIGYSFSVYLLMFTSTITNDYLMTVDSAFSVVMGYMCINICTVFYSMTATLFILTKSITQNNVKGEN